MRTAAVFGVASFFVVALAISAMARTDTLSFINYAYFPPGWGVQTNIYGIWWNSWQGTLIADPFPPSLDAPEEFQLVSTPTDGGPPLWEGNKLLNGVTLVPSKFEPQGMMHGDRATFGQYLRTINGPWMPEEADSGSAFPCNVNVNGVMVHAQMNVPQNTIIVSFPGSGFPAMMEMIGESGMALFGGLGNPRLYAMDTSCVITEWELASDATYPTPNPIMYSGIYVVEAPLQ